MPETAAPNVVTRKYRFRVARGNSIALGRGANNKLLKPGEYLPDDYPLNKARNLQRQGKVVAENLTMHPEYIPNTPVADPPGTSVKPLRTAGRNDMLDASKSDPFAAPRESIHVQTPSGIQTSSGPAEKAPQPVTHKQTLWHLDPAGLEGKTLDQLNVMILERDETVEPFGTTEEAIAFLSQHFESGE
jgi:hypothetical protein